MRPSETRTVQITEDDYLAAVRPLAPTDRPATEPSRRGPRPLDDRALLEELWRISHFGWMPEAIIRRALTLVRGQEIASEDLHGHLCELLERGGVERRQGDADDGEHHWRLTASGREAR